MTKEEIQALSDKINSGTATAEEKLKLLREVNGIITETRAKINKIKDEKLLEKTKEEINNLKNN